MKVITEAILRGELRCKEPEVYYIPEGKLLSPAAREYLQQRKIKIAKGAPPAPKPEEKRAETHSDGAPKAARAEAKYTDYETGAFFSEKPEHMTQLVGNVLVAKNHPRILFRGKLDSLQAHFVIAQAIASEAGESAKLVEDLGDILRVLREMMRCDALDEPFANETIIGLTHEELRERSHYPMKYFGIKQMTLPEYTMGRVYAELNLLRTMIRETEVAAASAFLEGKKNMRPDIMEELNRLSSAVHIMMCIYLAGMYKR